MTNPQFLEGDDVHAGAKKWVPVRNGTLGKLLWLKPHLSNKNHWQTHMKCWIGWEMVYTCLCGLHVFALRAVHQVSWVSERNPGYVLGQGQEITIEKGEPGRHER